VILQKLNNRKGFTLIELMVVIAIIGIIVAILIPNIIAMKRKHGASNKTMEVITQQEEKVLNEKAPSSSEQEKVVKQKGDMNRL
jgi:type IV pilus assembly protein PilA